MDVTTLAPILLIGVVFYFLIMRPARARQKKQAELLNSVAPGERIMTTSGIYGTILTVDDDDLTVEIAPGVVITIIKAAIGRVIKDDVVEEPEVPEALESADPRTPPPGSSDEGNAA